MSISSSAPHTPIGSPKESLFDARLITTPLTPPKGQFCKLFSKLDSPIVFKPKTDFQITPRSFNTTPSFGTPTTVTEHIDCSVPTTPIQTSTPKTPPKPSRNNRRSIIFETSKGSLIEFTENVDDSPTPRRSFSYTFKKPENIPCSNVTRLEQTLGDFEDFEDCEDSKHAALKFFTKLDSLSLRKLSQDFKKPTFSFKPSKSEERKYTPAMISTPTLANLSAYDSRYVPTRPAPAPAPAKIDKTEPSTPIVRCESQATLNSVFEKDIEFVSVHLAESTLDDDLPPVDNESWERIDDITEDSNEKQFINMFKKYLSTVFNEM